MHTYLLLAIKDKHDGRPVRLVRTFHVFEDLSTSVQHTVKPALSSLVLVMPVHDESLAADLFDLFVPLVFIIDNLPRKERAKNQRMRGVISSVSEYS